MFRYSLPQSKSDKTLQAKSTRTFPAHGYSAVKIKRDERGMPFGFIQSTKCGMPFGFIQFLVS